MEEVQDTLEDSGEDTRLTVYLSGPRSDWRDSITNMLEDDFTVVSPSDTDNKTVVPEGLEWTAEDGENVVTDGAIVAESIGNIRRADAIIVGDWWSGVSDGVTMMELAYNKADVNQKPVVAVTTDGSELMDQSPQFRFHVDAVTDKYEKAASILNTMRPRGGADWI